MGISSHLVGPSSHFADFFSRSFIVESGPHGSSLFSDLGVFLEESGSDFECVHSTLITYFRTLGPQDGC